MAKKGAAPLAPIQPDLLDVTAPLEKRLDHIFGNVHWKSADPNRAAIVWFLVLGGRCPFLSDPVCRKRLVLGKIEADRRTLDGRAGELHSSIHGFRVNELHVAELAVPELVHLQADHLDPATRLEEIEQILLGRINRDVTNPKRMAIRRFHALRPVLPAIGSF